MARLPRHLLEELGHISTTWAEIEQFLILHASAMGAQVTGGIPETALAQNFKRLREAWWEQLVARFPADYVRQVYQPLNMRLAAASRVRGDLLHGAWSVVRPGVYLRTIWAQRGRLESEETTLMLGELRAFGRDLDDLLRDLETTSG
jgi:hypothetical protein